jgi:hypothetical protein
MINKIKENKLWIVTFYKDDDEQDWEHVIAPSFNMAIKTAKKNIRENYDLKKGEKLGCSDFDAYIINNEYDIKGNEYQVILLKL